MPKISKQIIFLCALYSYSLSNLASKSVWNAVKHNLRRVISTLGEETSQPAVPSFLRHMTTLEKRFIQDLVNTFYIRVKTLKSCCIIKTDGNSNGKEVDRDPLAHVLENACQVFVGCFNSYLSNLEGLYVGNYGVVKANELRVESVSDFSDILGEAVSLGFLPAKIQVVAENYLRIMNGDNRGN